MLIRSLAMINQRRIRAAMIALRRAMGLNRRRFARVLGYSSPTIYRWEAGSVSIVPPVAGLIRLLGASEKKRERDLILRCLREAGVSAADLAALVSLSPAESPAPVKPPDPIIAQCGGDPQ